MSVIQDDGYCDDCKKHHTGPCEYDIDGLPIDRKAARVKLDCITRMSQSLQEIKDNAEFNIKKGLFDKSYNKWLIKKCNEGLDIALSGETE